MELGYALAAAKLMGLDTRWQVYHFAGTLDMWAESGVQDEVLKKKMDQLLEHKYAGDLHELVVNTNCREIFETPLVEHIGDHEIKVSMARIGTLLEYSPFRAVIRYVEIRGLKDEYADLKPYHMAKGSVRCWQDSQLRDEILNKKFDQLLQEKYGGSLRDMITNVDCEELFETPLIEIIAGRPTSVSLGRIGLELENRLYEAIRRYFTGKGLVEWIVRFRPYHMARASPNTWKDPAMRDEVLMKKVEQLLKERFGGDLVLLMTEACNEELFVMPLDDEVAGERIPIRMGGFSRTFNDSPYEAICRFLELKGLTALRDAFRPYHMLLAPRHTWENPQTRDEVLVKKVDQLLQEKFGGDLWSLLLEINKDDLFEKPLLVVLSGRPIAVSMAALEEAFHSSVFALICRYLEVRNETKNYWGIRPYHLSRASQGTWNDLQLCDEALVKKIEYLLAERYQWDIDALERQTTHVELFETPLVDYVGERPVAVSMQGIARRWNWSPARAIKRYREIKEQSRIRCNSSYSDTLPASDE